MTPVTPRLRLRSGVTVDVVDGERLTIRSADRVITVDGVPPAVRDAVCQLVHGETEDALADSVVGSAEPNALPMLYTLIGRLGELNALHYEVGPRAAPVARVEPMTRGFTFPAADLAPSTPLRLSRFAYLRRDHDEMLVESPVSAVRIALTDAIGVAAIAALTAQQSIGEIAEFVERLGASAEQVAGIVDLIVTLVALGFVTPLAPDGAAPDEDLDAALRLWQFHDLLFHARTRQGRNDYGYGGTFRFLAEVPPLPAVKSAPWDPVVELERPDLTAIAAHDPTLTDVLEHRRSIRAYGAEPLTLAQLSEFLYRVARVRAISPAAPEKGSFYDTSSRPYASGGAAYDLELYITANRCQGLEQGLYHYDPRDHCLRQVAEMTDAVCQLLQDAQRSAGLDDEPQVVITMASRFGRLSWKYSSMAYAAILKNVGVLYQTMYLVATAMGLAPCGLGGGDSDCFARASGIDYYAEGSVGEFLLGSADHRRLT